MSVKIIYWSQSGNTEAMAKAVADGVLSAGGEAETLFVGDAEASLLKSEKAFALGCPAMGAEVLEEDFMEPFIEEIESFVAGKKILLFGSYGWGDGLWMRDWVERMTNAGATVINNEGIICCGAPDDSVIEQLKSAGQLLI